MEKREKVGRNPLNTYMYFKDRNERSGGAFGTTF